jgi:hypothetical protein
MAQASFHHLSFVTPTSPGVAHHGWRNNASRPSASQIQQDFHRPPIQENIENEAFAQNKLDSLGLQLKSENNTITPVEQERLGVLQAKMNDFWAQRLERARRFGHNFATIPVHAPGNRIAAPVQPRPALQPNKGGIPPQYLQPAIPPQLIEGSTIQAQGDTTGNSPESSVEAPANKSGLPEALKAGIENLSGYSFDKIRVHYNSPRPARLQALAYAQGTAIHVAPGQEKHLSHEAWHIVQQMQGRVRPTMQINGEVKANDANDLEREADFMGAKASEFASPQSPQTLSHQSFQGGNSQVVQRVKGGLEYTEAGGTTLYQWEPSAVLGLAPHNAAPMVSSIAGPSVTFYAVPAGTYNRAEADNQDHIALKAETLRLENDVTSAEWIIERHGLDYNKNFFLDILGTEWKILWAKREALRVAVADHRTANPGQQIVLREGNHGSANLTEATADRVFEYDAQGTVGSVQITLGYKGSSAIENIALNNVSGFLTGGADSGDVRRERVGGSSKSTWLTDKLGTANQWVNARDLHSSLMRDMTAVEPKMLGGTIFGASQLATVQLMVLMDTMARMATFDSGEGAEASGKNIQKFFPKSARDSYVREMLGANYSDARMDTIRTRLIAAIPASVAKFYTALDALRLPLGAFREAHPTEATSQGLQHNVATTIGTAKIPHETALKELILGNQLAFSQTAQSIIKAYTDTTVDSKEQRRGNIPGNPFEYLVSVKPPQIVTRDKGGAVFEDRAEVMVTAGDLGTWRNDNPLRAAIVSLLRGA